MESQIASDPAALDTIQIRRRWLPPVVAHLLGSAKSMSGRLTALVAITAASLGIFIGGLSAIDSTLDARDRWFEEGHLADLQVHFRAVASDMLPDFSEVEGIESWRSRAVVLGSVEIGDNPQLTLQLVTGSSEEADLNSLVLLEGEFLDPEDNEGILIDWHLREYQAVKLSDVLVVTVGDTEIELTVRGVVRDAEFLLAPANPSLFVPTKGSLGVGFVNEATIEDIDGFLPVNSVLVRIKDGEDRAEVRQSILDFATDEELSQAYALGSDEQFASLFLEKSLAAFGTVVPVIVSVTGLSSIFVTFFLLAQWLTRERRALGVLMTLGYTAAHLARAFMVIIAVLALASIGLGVAVAYLLARLFIAEFATSVGLPLAETRFTESYLWAGVSGVAVIFVSAAIYAAVQVSRMTPLDAIRQVSGREKHPGRLSGWLGARLPTSWLRIAVRNTVRDKVVSLLTVVSMALGFGITASFFIAFSSVITTAQNQVSSSSWDLLADFRTPIPEQMATEIAADCGVSYVSEFVRGAVQASANDVHVNLYAGGYDPGKLWYRLPTILEGTDVTDDEPRGIMLEVATARELGVGMGDEVQLDSTSGHHSAEVIGIFSGALPGEARVTMEFAQEVFSLDGLVTGMFIKVTSANLDSVSQCVSRDKDVQQVLTLNEIQVEITTLSDQITSILRIGSSVSIVVALLFVMACLGYTVLKRAPDYQLLRCLGFRDRVVVATILAETWILGILAMILAIPIGALTAHYTAWRISQVWFHIETKLTLADYAQTFIPALVLLPLVALPMARAVLKESLDEFMRSREMG